MKIAIDSGYREERERYRLHLHCEHCALWDDARDACAHGYPTSEHRLPENRVPRRPEDDVEVVFCKDFELA